MFLQENDICLIPLMAVRGFAAGLYIYFRISDEGKSFPRRDRKKDSCFLL